MDPFHIAQTSMRDSPLMTERLEPCHTHRLDTTASVTTNSLRRRMIQTGDQPTDPFLTAQTSTRDSPSTTERLEPCHTHRLDTTAPVNTSSLRRRIQTGEHHMPLSLTAQISMRDSLSPMAEPEQSHTQRSDTTAPR